MMDDRRSCRAEQSRLHLPSRANGQTLFYLAQEIFDDVAICLTDDQTRELVFQLLTQHRS
jgi:hypothetical protein